MTLARARIIKRAFGDDLTTRPAPAPMPTPPMGRRVAREAIQERDDSASLAAAFLVVRREYEQRAEGDVDRIVELAKILAERLVGEGLELEPGRIAALAANALGEARGAKSVRIDANPSDVAALREALAAVGHTATVHVDAALSRGSLVVHTDLGTIDAQLRPQLHRLAKALREALR